MAALSVHDKEPMKLDTVAILAALIATSACKHKHDTKVVDPGDRTGTADSSGNGGRTDRDDNDTDKATVTADDGESMPSFAAVYFEFDSTVLTADARTELNDLGEWLEKHPKAKIRIEGNTDERGTDEYNIALGERRADAIKEYLGRLGVDDARLATISYGEERPAVSGDDENAWSKNRRGELVPNP